MYNKWANKTSSCGPGGPCEISVSDTTAFYRPFGGQHTTRLIDSQNLEALEKFHLDGSFSCLSPNSSNGLNFGNSQFERSDHFRVQMESSRGKRRSRD